MKYYLLIFFFMPLTTFSQVQKIKGKIIEQHTKTPIRYAHVFIQDIMYGTVTNEVGEFELTIDQRLMGDKLTISCIGYYDQLVPISTINNSDGIITLKKSTTLLNDIVISAKEDSARLILSKAMKAIKKNYPKHKYLQEAFYRGLGIKDSTYTRLIEAAITLQDNGYDAYDIDKDNLSVNNSKIKINEVRKSDDYRTYTLWGKVLNAFSYDDANNLYKMLQDDGIRFFGRKNNHVLGKQALEESYEIHLEEIHQFENNKIYHISLSTKHNKSFSYIDLSIYINSTDYAIIKIQRENHFRFKKEKENQYITKQPYFRSECAYSKYKGKYYLKYINTKRFSTGGATPIIDDGEKKSIQFDQLTLMVNEVYNKKDDFDRIKKREQSKRDIDLYESGEKYNEEFWKNYNIVLLNPLLNQVQRDLENKESLEKQFKKNGE